MHVRNPRDRRTRVFTWLEDICHPNWEQSNRAGCRRSLLSQHDTWGLSPVPLHLPFKSPYWLQGPCHGTPWAFLCQVMLPSFHCVQCTVPKPEAAGAQSRCSFTSRQWGDTVLFSEVLPSWFMCSYLTPKMEMVSPGPHPGANWTQIPGVHTEITWESLKSP